jgi:hypothetical protein
MGLVDILLALGLLVWLAFRGWSVLGLAPPAALIAAAFSGEPLLAHWTQTFMGAAGGFVAQFFPLFLLGALFAIAPMGQVLLRAADIPNRLQWSAHPPASLAARSARQGPSRGGRCGARFPRNRRAVLK